MNKIQRQEISTMKPIAYWSDLGGVEVYKIEDTIDGTIFYVRAGVMSGNPTYHRRKVLTFGMDGGHRDNIRIFNHRLYLDDCLRTNL